MNEILYSMTCPELSKIAVVIPINKNGDKKVIPNYWPISLTTSLRDFWLSNNNNISQTNTFRIYEKFGFISPNQFCISHKKKSNGVGSGDLGAHSVDPLLPVHFFG